MVTSRLLLPPSSADELSAWSHVVIAPPWRAARTPRPRALDITLAFARTSPPLAPEPLPPTSPAAPHPEREPTRTRPLERRRIRPSARRRAGRRGRAAGPRGRQLR